MLLNPEAVALTSIALVTNPYMSLMLNIDSLELEADKLDSCLSECISRLENFVGSNQLFSEVGAVNASTGKKGHNIDNKSNPFHH